MKRPLVSLALWFLAFTVTVALAGFQRRTGPSYPVRGALTLEDGSRVEYRLPRSHGGAGGLEIHIPAEDGWTGRVRWRRYPTQHPWQTIDLTRHADALRAEIPHQPPAGKVEYELTLTEPEGVVHRLGGDASIVARFRAGVPGTVLVPHILAMFGCMLVATRSVLEVLRKDGEGRALVLLAMSLLILGGLILGPVVQKFAFGAFWTGWPLGSDLTDNKTAIAFLAWLPAAIVAWRRRRLRFAVIAGWVVMMTIFMIPHSMRGSELSWEDRPPVATPTSEPR
jgi:hypothetical protein